MSSILDGILTEAYQRNPVYMLYLDGVRKGYVKDVDNIERYAEVLRKKYPNNKVEIKHEMFEGEETQIQSRADSDIDESLNENLHKWFKEKWVRFGPDGKIRGACARGSDSEGKPKCLPQSKAHSLGKKGRKYAAAKKRREDPNPERTGKAINVATKKKTNEEYCPECGGNMYPESMINEKKDACYYKVKSRYKVWPSAYASGALVKCRKSHGKWGSGSKKNEDIDEAANAAQQAAIAINMKKQGKKPKNESSVIKGIVDEGGETVYTIYINSKPSLKYHYDYMAKEAAQELEDLSKKKGRQDKIEIRKEVRGGIGGNQLVGEGDVVKGPWDKDITPIGQLKTYNSGVDFDDDTKGIDIIGAYKVGDKVLRVLTTKDFEPDMGPLYQIQNGRTVEIPRQPVQHEYNSYIFDGGPKDMDAVAEVEEFGGKIRYNDNLTGNPKDIWYKLPKDLAIKLHTLNLARTKKQLDSQEIPAGARPDYHNLKEGVIVGHDKDDPEVAVLGGAGTMSLSRLKKKAHGEAKQLADDIANGNYSASSYNMKQLHNTLNTIVAAEAEMKKLYFGESIDWQHGNNNNEHDHLFSEAMDYLKHLYPFVKQYLIRRAEVGFRSVKSMDYLSSSDPSKHLDDKQFLKSMSHMKNVDAVIKYLNLNRLSMMSGSKQVTASIGYTWTTFISPSKDFGVIYYQDRGMGQDMIVIGAKDKATHRKIYDVFVDAGVIVGRAKKVKEPELPQGMRVSGANSRDDAYNRAMNKFLGKNDDDGVNEDYTGEFAAEVTPAINPYGGSKDRKFRGAIAEALLSEMPTDNPTGSSGEGGWRTYKPKSAGRLDETQYEYDADELSNLLRDYYLSKAKGDPARGVATRIRNALYYYKGGKVTRAELLRSPGMGKQGMVLIDTLLGRTTPSTDQYSYYQSQIIEFAEHLKNAIAKKEIDQAEDLLSNLKSALNALKRANPVSEDTSFGTGMGQGGNAGESYRKFKPKSAGTFEEEQLDEKCWDGYKQVGMKNKGNKMVPNCVKSESSILKGITGKK